MDPARRTTRAAQVFALLIGVAGVASTSNAPPVEAAATTSTFAVVADGTVDAATPAVPYGDVKEMGADATPAKLSYLRFAPSGLGSSVQRAVLRVHVRDRAWAASPSRGQVRAVASTGWTEATLTYAARPALGAVVATSSGRADPGAWVEFDVTSLVRGSGAVAMAIASTHDDGVYYDAREAGNALAPRLVVTHDTTAAAPTTLLAAGDIAGCRWSGDEATAKVLDRHPAAVIATLGDNVQDGASRADFSNCFGPTWGRHKARIRPAVGNHEYKVDAAAPYWDYFGAAAGPRGQGWYSYDLGTSWHVVVLNGNCWETGRQAQCGPNSAQYRWLAADLAASNRPCTLAYWHQPYFSSVARSREVKPFWDLLYAEGAELVLSGHTHNYERFAPQRPDGTRDNARGIRQFEVGTGGTPHLYDYATVLPNSEVRNNRTHGVLKLDLEATGYRWQFLPVAGQTFTDAGSASCH